MPQEPGYYSRTPERRGPEKVHWAVYFGWVGSGFWYRVAKFIAPNRSRSRLVLAFLLMPLIALLMAIAAFGLVALCVWAGHH